MNEWLTGSYRQFSPSGISMVVADPVYESSMVPDIVSYSMDLTGGPILVFMYPEDVHGLPERPDRVLHWIKPESTKNTSKTYSRFVEVIAVFNQRFGKETLHWSNRTGIFTDRLYSNEVHPWRKPEPLIERLIRNHYTSGIVLDPCAGSGVVHDVCVRLGIPSVSIEKDPHLRRETQ